MKDLIKLKINIFSLFDYLLKIETSRIINLWLWKTADGIFGRRSTVLVVCFAQTNAVLCLHFFSTTGARGK